jgi:hypothetical protein
MIDYSKAKGCMQLHDSMDLQEAYVYELTVAVQTIEGSKLGPIFIAQKQC